MLSGGPVSYLAPPLLASAIAVGLLVIVLRRDRRSQANQVFSFLLISIMMWGILIYLMRASPDTTQALFWDRLVVPAPTAVYLLYYHFSVVLTKARRQTNLLRVSYFLFIMILVVTPTGVFVRGMNVRPYGYSPVFTSYMIPVFLFASVLLIISMYNFAQGYRSATRYEEKNRLLLIMIGMAFPFAGSAIDIFMTIFPASIYGTIIFCLLAAVAILKYHLLDVRVVLRKSLAYLLVSSMVAVPYAAALLIVSGSLRAEAQPWWIQGPLIIVLAIVLRPLYGWAQRIVDKAFYRERYDSLKALVEFSRQRHSVEDLEELGATVVKLANSALRASTVSLLLRYGTDKSFRLEFSSGFENIPDAVVIGEDSPIITWLELRRNVVTRRDLSTVPQLQGLSAAERRTAEMLGAELYVPIITKRGQMVGIMILGRKRSEQFYSLEDKQLLLAVSGQIGMSLDNALLYGEARRSEKALRDSEEKLRLVFDSVNEGIMLIDLGGRILQINKTVLRMHGYSRQELQSQSLAELVAEKDRAKFTAAMMRLTECGDVGRAEYSLLKRDESEFPGELSGALVRDASNNPVGIVIVTQDITQRKQAENKEKQLQQELQLSDRLASIGQLVSGVAHEINNPLTAILGFSQRLLRKSTDKATGTDLERIHSEALRVAKVVENLRTFARRKEPQKEVLNINDILQKALDVSSFEAKSNNIEILKQLDADPPVVMADSHQIQQVFLNIILNAKQAMAETGGRLVIKTSKEAGFIRVAFTDNGPGLSPENFKKLFEPFFTTKGDSGGIGLGLSICHGIVRDHGGRIYAASKLGEGTTFFVELPVSTDKSDENMIPRNYTHS